MLTTPLSSSVTPSVKCLQRPRASARKGAALGLSTLSFLGLAAAALGLVGCGSAASTGSGDGAHLHTQGAGERSQFVLQSATGFKAVNDTLVQVSFSDKEINFNAGCNSHFGQYHLNDGVLIVGNMASTMMGCDAALHQQDDWLSTFFSSKPTVAIQGNHVKFTGKNGELTFLKREIALPALPLVGTAWSVDTFITSDAVMSGEFITGQLRFNSDDSFSVQGPCNTLSGRFSVKEQALTFSGVAITEKACLEPDQTKSEQHLVQVFSEGNANYTIDYKQLTIKRGALGVGARSEK